VDRKGESWTEINEGAQKESKVNIKRESWTKINEGGQKRSKADIKRKREKLMNVDIKRLKRT